MVTSLSCSYLDRLSFVVPSLSHSADFIDFFHGFNELHVQFQLLLFFVSSLPPPLHTPPYALSCPLTTDEAIKDVLQKKVANSTAAVDANTPKRQRGISSLIPDGLT